MTWIMMRLGCILILNLVIKVKKPNAECNIFFEQLEAASRSLYEGSPHSQLSIDVRLLSSMVEFHLAREITDFGSYYFESSVPCFQNRPNRHDNGGETMKPLSIFNQPGKGSKKRTRRNLSAMEFKSTSTHVLLNCPQDDDISSVHHTVDVELENDLEHPEHILEEVDIEQITDEGANASINKEELFDEEEWSEEEDEDE
ncbi:hypothetical protein H5410_026643 [Solanum commersonii]|uniref:Uncharacterized protein n=1 Tax=Solanum commersonii TaxID=4109 RepID=A0A9J5YZL7_SOLCO|nr:hypothetical protein H5410_026643 [Solanum commersonii]